MYTKSLRIMYISKKLYTLKKLKTYNTESFWKKKHNILKKFTTYDTKSFRKKKAYDT